MQFPSDIPVSATPVTDADALRTAVILEQGVSTDFGRLYQDKINYFASALMAEAMAADTPEGCFRAIYAFSWLMKVIQWPSAQAKACREGGTNARN